MARVCSECGKRTETGNNRSHSMKATKRKFKPNIFVKNIIDESWKKQRKKICSRCYKLKVKQGAI